MKNISALPLQLELQCPGGHHFRELARYRHRRRARGHYGHACRDRLVAAPVDCNRKPHDQPTTTTTTTSGTVQHVLINYYVARPPLRHRGRR